MDLIVFAFAKNLCCLDDYIGSLPFAYVSGKHEICHFVIISRHVHIQHSHISMLWQICHSFHRYTVHFV